MRRLALGAAAGIVGLGCSIIANRVKLPAEEIVGLGCSTIANRVKLPAGGPLTFVAPRAHAEDVGPGLHQLGAEGLEIEVTEPVILDGEAFPAGRYRVEQGPELTFVTP